MRKNTLIGPFWKMLIIAVLDAFFNYAIATAGVKMRLRLSLGLFLVFFWPTLLFIETGIYWLVRKTVVNRRQAWGHVFLMFFAFIAIPLIRATIVFYSYRIFASLEVERMRFLSIIWNIELISFWALFIGGHVLFTLMLKNAFAPPVVIAEDPENINLLDDVLN